MIFMVCLLLIGNVYISYQAFLEPTPQLHYSELMVESNTSLETNTIMSVLITNIEVHDSNEVLQTLNLQENELVSVCLFLDNSYECNCSVGYMWTNDVCYTYGCCSENTCRMTQPLVKSFCTPKVKVRITGTVQMSFGSWSSEKATELETGFRNLSGFEDLNFTAQSDISAAFETALSVQPRTSKLQEIVDGLDNRLLGKLFLKNEGLVNIESPSTTVLYKASQVLKCTFNTEETGVMAWYLTNGLKTSVLNPGSVVSLDHNCATKENQLCTAVTLNDVTGAWKGTYECEFKIGSVMYIAKTQMDVALLPDKITMEINPLTADCTTTPYVNVKATIANSSEEYVVTWTHTVSKLTELPTTSSLVGIVYSATAHVSCQQTTRAQYVNVTFRNSMSQKKSQQLNIPVIYENTKFCSEDESSGLWPKTPDGDTVINRTCDDEKVGYKSRTCQDSAWQSVFNYCVNKELSEVLNAAEDFEKGLGSSQEMAMEVFKGLKNHSTFDSDSIESIADVTGAINVLDVMANASNKFSLMEEVFSDFVASASNILDNAWQGVNESTINNMSSKYLHSVESLVKNIRVNKTDRISSTNVNVSICSGSDCSVRVFDVNVNVNNATTMLKTVGVKNLVDKLYNNPSLVPLSDKVIIATVEDNRSSPFRITLDFPNKSPGVMKPLCVFWHTIRGDWSEAGCTVKSRHDDHTVCECNHLTSFSVLMGKSDTPNKTLSVITYVGLSVSICSLLIFLFIECLLWSALVKTNISHFRHTAMVNIATFCLLGNCSFLASSSAESLPDEWCLILTMCKHLFYLAMFSWMLCLSVMLVHQIIFVFSPLRKRVFMFLSSMVGYVCPLVIVGSSYLFCKYTNKRYYDTSTCWLVYDRLLEGSLHSFLLPMGTVMFTNLFSMVVVIITLIKTSVPDGSKAQDKETAKSIFKVVIYLTPVFGITWGFGFLLRTLSVNDPAYTIVEYIFTILNSFQGLFILVTGCFTEQKVREELIIILTCKKRADNTQNTTSNTYTKAK